MRFSGDIVFDGIDAGSNESDRFVSFLNQGDFSANTRKARTNDLRKFAKWFTNANGERFSVERVTQRDVVDFRQHLRRSESQSISTVNRALVSLRKYFGFLVVADHIQVNPVVGVKELRKQQSAPKGLQRQLVRKLLREVEIRHDIRANAAFHLMLYTGCRVSDIAELELSDVVIQARSGSVTFRHGKGNKERTVPLPLPARKAIQAYLDIRPDTESEIVFQGKRGPLTDRGFRALCDKYGELLGFKLHPHLLRHTMAHKFLDDTGNDLVSLAQLLGHQNINTTAIYTKRTQDQLAAAVDNLSY